MKKFILVLLTALMLVSLFATVAFAEGETSDAGAIVDVELDWHPEGALNNLKYMGLGMLGIFVVVGVVMLITYALNAITAKKK
ncbi:MAG: hypothetical protein IIW39_03345 [Clostridia bacterium]|nr:hypothetical protein [Clostridia bacterium]MBQ5837688.1 hypothetical protein [Clostridia bacterium]